MWLEAFDRLQKRRFHRVVWLTVIFAVMALLLVQGLRINEKAEQVRLRLLVQSFYESASSLRQQWELQGRPQQAELDGVRYGFTRLGWPLVLTEGRVDCAKTWDLLSSGTNPTDCATRCMQNKVRSMRYYSCYYEVTSSKGLVLFYENETMHVDVFLTRR